MKQTISIRQFLENFDQGCYSSPDTNTQISAGWYDWFCSDKVLHKKTEVLVKKLKRIVNSKKINQDTQCVWFKNNCPVSGLLYDDIRISDIETGDTVWCIVPRSGHKVDSGMGEVWSGETWSTAFTGSWKDIIKWFNEE